MTDKTTASTKQDNGSLEETPEKSNRSAGANNEDNKGYDDVTTDEEKHKDNGVKKEADGKEEVEDDEESSDDDEDEEEDDEDEDEDEPKLRYRRVGASVKELLQKDTASTLRVSDRFVALGTHWGAVHILDFEGNVIKSFKSHSATINDISIDNSMEYVASASDDGKVNIYALYTPEIQSYNFKRPIKSVALDPEYARKGANKKKFVSGGLAEQLILSTQEKRTNWFSSGTASSTTTSNHNYHHKDVVLHANEGPIYAIRWAKNFIAWANDTGVKIYDTDTNLRITYIDRPENSPRAELYRCRLAWKTDHKTLLIGWADTVKVAVVQPKPEPVHPGQPRYYVEIVHMFQTDYMICGIAPFGDMLMLLAYFTEEQQKRDQDEDTELTSRRNGNRWLASKPELHIINANNEEISADVLALHGFELYQANDYVLDFLMDDIDSEVAELNDEKKTMDDLVAMADSMFYIMGPKDLIAARSRDVDDHIEWLLDHEKFGDALTTLRALSTPSKRFNEEEVGQTYLHWLMKVKQYQEAAKECPSILKHDPALWEDWIFRFLELGELSAIAPFIPIEDPQLSSTVYEIVLACFLKSDYEGLLKTIQQWPKTLYSLSNVIVAVEDVLRKKEKKQQHHPITNEDKDDEILLECLAELYTMNNQPDKAIEYNLRLRRPNAFELIQEYNMFDAVKDKAVLLLEFDQYLAGKEGNKQQLSKMPAVQLLVKNTDAIPPAKVVKQLERHRQFLHIYLDALFDRDHQLGFQFHDLQVELYAEYDYPKLLPFLRASHYISLEKAFKLCEKKDLVPEMVFILGRMGNNKKALMLIIERLGDVQMAIDFAKEQKDNELWEDLLTYSMDKPKFICGLLENVGTEIDPLRLIQRIPDDLEIPGLKEALIKILQDYNLQMSLHAGCEKILVRDSVFLADKMYKAQKRGVHCHRKFIQICCCWLIVIITIGFTQPQNQRYFI
ncbi:hypothetical protein BDF20DRAFT_814816 [Mycotypha africana]|uniref:uncharacterized protein n=1 Tax=Mycotypha africana TaxID=64632 RepID=UPI0023018746|nr:uncharacterized protein BDF20DRAFT_814816 [Mycotypha africana]KAI8987337.1 hypothetical protein BDF20DRAFT_814816 [Mycotypha africana]